jgi:hypothetical protein
MRCITSFFIIIIKNIDFALNNQELYILWCKYPCRFLAAPGMMEMKSKDKETEVEEKSEGLLVQLRGFI